MKYDWDLYEVKFTDLEDEILGEFYVAAENFLKAVEYALESLNSENEFISQIKFIGNVEFEIEDKFEKNKKWGEFVEKLDVRTQITNALLKNTLTVFDSYEIELENAPEWFMREIKRHNGGRIQHIRNIGEKSILDIRDALRKNYEQ